jgi:hypothetical protein
VKDHRAVAVRYYREAIAPFDTFAWEAEWESLAAHEKVLDEGVRCISAEMWDQWNQLTERGAATSSAN